MTTNRLKDAQLRLKNYSYHIWDEVSFIGQKTFIKINARMQEIYGNDLDFGGKNIIIIGDFSQLPPVKDHILYYQPEARKKS